MSNGREVAGSGRQTEASTVTVLFSSGIGEREKETFGILLEGKY